MTIRVLACLLVLAACADPVEQRARAGLDEARAALAAGDANAAIAHARRALAEGGEAAPLELVVAEASLKLERVQDALDAAGRGREADDDGELAGRLDLVSGSALMARYLQLKSDDDWREANALLERAVAGLEGAASLTGLPPRLQAAYFLARLQTVPGHENVARLEKFGRIVLAGAPESSEAEVLRGLFAAKGLSP